MNRGIKNKMTKDEFVRNNRGINDNQDWGKKRPALASVPWEVQSFAQLGPLKDLPREYLESLYDGALCYCWLWSLEVILPSSPALDTRSCQVFLRIQSHCKKTRRQRQLVRTDAHRQEPSLEMVHQKTFWICQARNRQESQAARDLNQKHMPWLSGRQGLGLTRWSLRVIDDSIWQCFFSKRSKTYGSAVVVCLLM